MFLLQDVRENARLDLGVDRDVWRFSLTDPKFLDEREVHREYNLSVPWLRKRRRTGDGPSYLKIGRMVRYCREDLEAYLAAHRVR